MRPAIGAVGVRVLLERDVERPLHGSDAAGEPHASPRPILRDDLQPGRPGKSMQRSAILCGRAMRVGIGLAADMLAGLDRVLYPRVEALTVAMAQHHGDFDLGRCVRFADDACAGQRCPLAAWNRVFRHGVLLNSVIRLAINAPRRLAASRAWT